MERPKKALNTQPLDFITIPSLEARVPRFSFNKAEALGSEKWIVNKCRPELSGEV
jgi:hypothetical protein